MHRTLPLLVTLLTVGCGNAGQDVDAPPTAAGTSTSQSASHSDPASVSASETTPVSDASGSVAPTGSESIAPSDSESVAPADIDQLFTEFIESPDRESYLAIRRAIIASDAYQPYSEELQASGDYLHRRMYDQARAAVDDAMPNLLLSPQAHWLLAEIDSLAGDDESAERERKMATACLEGILSTGDGSAQQPYLVLRQSDEDDLLTHLDKRPEFHDFRHLDEQHFDVFRLADRSEIWFDVTELIATTGATFE